MEGTIGLSLALLMSIVPALLFLGLWKGLESLQSSSVVQQSAERADVDDPSVSMGDAVDAVTNPDKSILGGSKKQYSGSGCTVCGSSNEEGFRYCGSCGSRL